MQKICPRCNAPFDCRNDNIAECHCIDVNLDARQREYIGDSYEGCLCHACLLDVQKWFCACEVNPKFNNSTILNS